jgi:hypothetical protein
MDMRHRHFRRVVRVAGAAVAAGTLLGACATDVVQSNVTSPPATEQQNYASLIRVGDAMRASGDNAAAAGL